MLYSSETAPPSATAKRRAERPQFPQPVRFNGKRYYRRSDLDHFKLALEAFALGRPAPTKAPPPPGDPLVPHVGVASQFGVTPRSVDRWIAASKAEAA